METRFKVALGFMAAGLMVLTACGPKYPDCNDDENCKEHGEYCVDGTCKTCAITEHCKSLGPCGFCNSTNACETPKGDNGDCCVSDENCNGLKCFMTPGAASGTCAQCMANGDCGDKMKCVQGNCVPVECISNADCGAHKKCENDVCVDDLCKLNPVYFDFDESLIRADQRQTMSDNYACIGERGIGGVQMAGHCDDRGADEYNLALGKRRAKSTEKYMRNLGMKPKAMKTRSFGEEKPVCWEATESCYWKNRRTEFEIQ